MGKITDSERFTKAPVALIGLVENKTIKQFDYLLWHVLWSFSDSVTRRCFPAQGTLAKATASKRDTVRDGLKRLEDAGAIVCVVRHPKGSRKPNTYQIVDDVAEWRVSPAPSSGHEDISHGADRGHEEERHGTDQGHEGLDSHGTERGHEESSWPPSGSRHGTDQGHVHDPHRGHYQEPKNNNHLTRTTISPSRPGSEHVTDEKKSSDEEMTPMAIPTDWVPSEQHASRMDELNFDHELMAGTVNAFYQRFDSPEILSTDWDRKFGWWINEVHRNPKILEWTAQMSA